MSDIIANSAVALQYISTANNKNGLCFVSQSLSYLACLGKWDVESADKP